MRDVAVEIDCKEDHWKALLKEELQDGQEVTLSNFDYTANGTFCELLSVSHGVSFRIDYKNSIGFFRKRA